MSGQQQQLNVDLSSAADVTCEKCGSRFFREVVMVKRVSALMSPTGKEALVPVGTFGCVSCGHVNMEFDPIARLSQANS